MEKINKSSNTPSVKKIFSDLGQEYTVFYIYDFKTYKIKSVSSTSFLSKICKWAQLLDNYSDPIIPVFGRMTEHMLSAWLGIMLAGKLPVFISYPNYKISIEEYELKLKVYVSHFKNTIFIGEKTDKNDNGKILIPSDLESISSIKLSKLKEFYADPKRPIFLQCSSGSTGLQKAIAITASQLEHQVSNYAKAINLLPDRDVIASWLPLYHDMGLIATYLMPLLTKTPVIYIDTFEWASNPELLLQIIESSKTTLCWLPNFAFTFMRKAHRKYNLSSMRSFISCAEPVTENSFKYFSTCQDVSNKQFSISYALAENVFAATQTTIGESPLSIRLNKTALQEGVVKMAETYEDINKTKLIFSCGKAINGTELKIECDTNKDIGEVFIRGSSAIKNYFRLNPFSSDGWFPTGDLGFIHNNELYITGRCKDVIIQNGKNVYPQDLEEIANQHPQIYKGRNVAIGWQDEEMGSERVLLIFEPKKPYSSSVKNQICSQLKQKLEILFTIKAEVVCVPHMWLKKTSSGKIARKANLDQFIKYHNRNIYVFGDSGACIFQTRLCSGENYYKRIHAFWVLGRAIELGLKTIFFNRIAEIYSGISSDDILILYSGEPECRFIFPIAKDPFDAIDNSVSKYEKFFKALKKKVDCEIAYMTGIPVNPGVYGESKTQYDPQGTPEVRYKWQKIFYEKMKEMCSRYDITFIDLCTPLIGKNGFLDKNMLLDKVHLKYEYRDLVVDILEKNLGYINRELASHKEMERWDGTYKDYLRLTKQYIRTVAANLYSIDYEHLVSSGTLDSLAIIDFICYLEKTFCFRIPIISIEREDFESIAQIFKSFNRRIFLYRLVAFFTSRYAQYIRKTNQAVHTCKKLLRKYMLRTLR